MFFGLVLLHCVIKTKLSLKQLDFQDSVLACLLHEVETTLSDHEIRTLLTVILHVIDYKMRPIMTHTKSFSDICDTFPPRLVNLNKLKFIKAWFIIDIYAIYFKSYVRKLQKTKLLLTRH